MYLIECHHYILRRLSRQDQIGEQIADVVEYGAALMCILSSATIIF